MRSMGKAYSSKSKNGEMKKRAARCMGPGCGPGCKFKCHHNLSYTQRDSIFEGFWAQCCINRQRDFIARHVVEKKTKRPTKNKKKISREYYLEVDGSKYRVCKTFFTHTLAVSRDVVTNTMKKKTNVGTVTKDRRGKHMKQRRLSDDLRENIRRHIRSFPTVPAHYVRRDSKRQYIEVGLSVAKMYACYVEWCRENRYKVGKKYLYHEIFYYDFNLGVYKPKKDQCSFCKEYNNAEEKEGLQSKYDQHLINKETVRTAKEEAKQRSVNDNSFVCAIYDFQRVLPCPKGDTSTFYYKRKLSVFNFTVYDTTDKDVICYVWHEGEAGRGGNEVATCVRHYFEKQGQQGKKEIAFFRWVWGTK